MKMGIKDKERSKQVLLYTLGLLDQLKTDGMIEGGVCDLTDEGRQKFQELKEYGFEPASEEILDIIDYLQQNAEEIDDELAQRCNQRYF
jgi:hypothetical protein